MKTSAAVFAAIIFHVGEAITDFNSIFIILLQQT